MEYKLLNQKKALQFEPTNTGTYAEAKGGTEMMYEGLTSRLDPELLKHFQIICSRVRNVDESKIPILWMHDTWDDPENKHLADPKSRSRFKKFVFVSNYQFQTYNLMHGVPYRESAVLRNAIVPIEAHEKPKDQINIIYHTTPHRGLDLLVPAFDHLCKFHHNIHLDVYSSFGIYGWPHRDKPYEKVFDKCRSHPKITYHGHKPNAVIREALKKAHIFAYPSIWPETSCIAAIEAMSAGCAVVCSDLAALPETSVNMAFLYRYNENPPEHVNEFASVLHNVIKRWNQEELQTHLTKQTKLINTVYDWEVRIPQWKTLLEEILNGQNHKSGS